MGYRYRSVNPWWEGKDFAIGIDREPPPGDRAGQSGDRVMA